MKKAASSKKNAGSSRKTAAASSATEAKSQKNDPKAKKTYRDMVRRMWGEKEYRQKINEKVMNARDRPSTSAGREAKTFLKSELYITDTELAELGLEREDVELKKKKRDLCTNNTTFVLLSFGAQLE